MPEVKVRFFTTLREVVNKREETLTFSESQTVTVDLVLKTLSKKYGIPFTGYVYDGKTGQPKNFLQFLVNGTSTSTLNGLETSSQGRRCFGYSSTCRRRLKSFF